MFTLVRISKFLFPNAKFATNVTHTFVGQFQKTTHAWRRIGWERRNRWNVLIKQRRTHCKNQISPVVLRHSSRPQMSNSSPMGHIRLSVQLNPIRHKISSAPRENATQICFIGPKLVAKYEMRTINSLL